MLALTFVSKQHIEVSNVPKPVILHPTDVIVRVTTCSICGSDLHPFHEREKGIAAGTIVGHEFAGVVAEKGSSVTSLAIGDRVMSPFTACCGQCFYCNKGWTCRCCHSQARVFGWLSQTELSLPPKDRASLHGSQAQYVRVPLADSTLVHVPDGVSDEEAVLLGDIIPTGFFCADNGGISPGDVVVVLGAGPVGLMAVLGAQHRQAAKVFAVDSIPERLAMAQRLGAEPLKLGEVDVGAAVRAATDGRGADVVLEVVGSNPALQLAFELLRPCGTLSSVGVHTHPTFPFTPTNGYDKNLTYRSGRCPARAYMDKLLPLVQQKKYDFTAIVTHRLPLSDGVHGYNMFDAKADGCTKVMLNPWPDGSPGTVKEAEPGHA